MIKNLAWAWIIFLGGMILTPGGFICLVCGPVGDIVVKLIGIMSIAIGILGLGFTLRERFQ